MTIREALQSSAARLREEPLLEANASLDARSLVGLATGRDYVGLLASPYTELTENELVTLQALLERRLRFEPIQHLRGTQEFYGREFIVTRDVLIPRPETEDIVTAVLEALPDRSAPLRIADVGTGSGALAITLALELPESQVTGIDISAAALAVAERNRQRWNATGRVQFLQSNLLSAMDPGETFHVIVSNPPYIPSCEAASLHPEVREYEPHLALFAGEDGLDLYRRLIPQAEARLRPGGLLLLETAGNVDHLLRWLNEWESVHVRRDLQGIPRILSARRPREDGV